MLAEPLGPSSGRRKTPDFSLGKVEGLINEGSFAKYKRTLRTLNKGNAMPQKKASRGIGHRRSRVYQLEPGKPCLKGKGERWIEGDWNRY